MMQTNTSMCGADSDDTELVGACLGGDRDAFAQIVARYQALIASIAYSATGNIAQSEDLTQETFLAAWRHLNSLEEPSKLRAWLCGIARHATANALRRQQREPSQHAHPLDEVMDAPAPGPIPADRAISHEEEAILWRSLEEIPETYREPLILFYREDQSVERVAETLELSHDAVRQRLSRGRKLLEERVASFVEGALRQSIPGCSFTANVMAVIPAQIATGGIASVGATAAKGSATNAATLLAGLTTLVSFLPGAVSSYQAYKIDMAEAGSDRERRAVRRFYAVLAAMVLLPVLLIYLAVYCRQLALTHTTVFTGVVIAIALSWIPGLVVLLALLKRKCSAAAANAEVSNARPALEYCTTTRFLGLPLLHVRFGGPPAMRWRPVKAWIALGDVAFGGLFAFGGVTIAPLCFGGVALGAVVFGGFAAGALTYAGFGLGIWAVGGFVMGWWAIGGCAIAWTASLGGIGIAREFARGGIAVALHANDSAANSYIANSGFFRAAFALVTTWLWPTMLAATVPSILLAMVRRRKQKGVK
jgi:RNA polymerase sigma factor (sigma-70 family)